MSEPIWNEEKEREFQKRKREWFAQEAREDEEKQKRAELGLSPKCPNCGSHRYLEGIKHESCSDCGLSESYW